MAVNKLIMRKAIAKRFRQFYEEKGLTQIDLGKAIGVHQNNISSAVSDNAKRGVPRVWIYKTKQAFPDLNLDWILKGEGEMFIRPDTLPVSAVREPVPMYPERLGALKSFDEVDLERLVLRLVARLDELERRVAVLEGGGTKGD